MKRLTPIFIIFTVVLLSGCNLPLNSTPTSNPGDVETQAARTVEAELTRLAPQASATTSNPTSTWTTAPTNTSAPPPTSTSLPCNKAKFITDVTYPDNTVVTAGSAFTKTWRLQNIGTCTWSSSYQLTFISGDTLGVPSGYAQALTSGYVSPGQNIDVSVNLTAPMTGGTYTGRWGFREPGGTIFSNFIVVIQVPAATSHSLTVNVVPAESGMIQGDGGIYGPMNAGDSTTNVAFEGFLSFDISGIPTNATITEVKMDLSSGYDLLGSPFAHLGCLKVYMQNYVIPLIAGNFVAFPAPSGEDHSWCSTSDLNTAQADNDFKSELQGKLGVSNRIQYRLQFGIATNSDNAADAVRLGAPKLLVTYTTP